MTPLRVTLEGHLTAQKLEGAVAPVEAELETSTAPRGVIFDCQAMTGYEFSARTTFVTWNKKNREAIDRVAIVTDRALWRVVIGAMALASRQNMKAFPTLGEADAWASGRAN